MEFKVYDDTKSLLASFATRAEADKFVYNNDDISAFINDERVVEIKHVPVDAMPVYTPPPAQPKLLDAAAALERIKAAQSETVNSIVEQVIEAEGVALFQPQHRLIIQRLQELGFTVKLEEECMEVSIEGAV